MTDKDKIDQLRAILGVILDCVDYTDGACAPTEMIGACLPRQQINQARQVIRDTQSP